VKFVGSVTEKLIKRCWKNCWGVHCSHLSSQQSRHRGKKKGWNAFCVQT